MIKLKYKRKEKKLTQKQIADSLGIKPNTVSQWESNVRKPSIDTLLKLSSILDCSMEELLGTDESTADRN